MRIIDFPRQIAIVAPTTVVSSWMVPCEGAVSRVDGMLIITVKDYVNQPTLDLVDLQFGNNVFNLMANQCSAIDTVGGVAAVPAVSLKETDLGIEVHDFITSPGIRMTMTVRFTAVPGAGCMLYWRPRFMVSPYVAGPKPDGGRQEVSAAKAYSMPYEPFPAEPAMGQTHDVGAITVIKETVKR